MRHRRACMPTAYATGLIFPLSHTLQTNALSLFVQPMAEVKKVRNPRAPRYLLNAPIQLPAELAVFPGASCRDVARALGTEVIGVQLKDLDQKQVTALEKLIAQRGVVFFR